MKTTKTEDIEKLNKETLARMRGPRMATASTEKPVLVANPTPDTFES